MMMINRKLGIYIHIPFCISRCRYCGFYSNAIATTAKTSLRGLGSTCEGGCKDVAGVMEGYTDDLCREIVRQAGVYGKNRVVDTVFFGGGTPSLLSGDMLKRIMDSLRSNFSFGDDVEVTSESNPKTLSEDKLRAMRAAGINRLSIGVQSMDDGVLKILGRAHSSEEFLRAYRAARAAGFDNINVDLMFAVPGQTMGIWQETVGEVVDIAPEHISFYSLQIEEGTPFYDDYKNERLEFIPVDIDRRMYHWAREYFLKNGYENYEISNTSRQGRRCRHNLKYWNMQDYLGLGAGASSFIDGVRFRNAESLDYLSMGLPEVYRNTTKDTAAEFMFTGLRKTEGVSLKDFNALFEEPLMDFYSDRVDEIEAEVAQGNLVFHDGRIFLTEKGIDISNEVMAIFV